MQPTNTFVILKLRAFFTDLDDNSILMIYQHYYRYKKPSLDFFGNLLRTLCKRRMRLVYIDDNTIMFLFLTKNTHLKEKLEVIPEDYRKKYPGSFSK